MRYSGRRLVIGAVNRAWQSGIALLLLGGFSSIATGAPTARLEASRISGPAPLAVFFDATATSHSSPAVSPFRDLAYRFDFDDLLAGNWSVSGRSKNEQIGGPLAAHVFERPGVYRVTVTVTDASGTSSSSSVSITVRSAEDDFSGAKTVCLSTSGDFGGCPANAERISNPGSWPVFQSSRRYLLRRGEDFRHLGSINLRQVADVQLAAFGSGAKPIVSEIYLLSGDPPYTRWISRIVVAELDAGNIVNLYSGRDLLLLRNTLNRGGMIDIAAAFGYYLERSSIEGWQNPENMFVVENEIDRRNENGGYENPNGITGNAHRFALLGNTVNRTQQHNVRIWQAHKAFIAHNALLGNSSESIRLALKLNSTGLGEVTEALRPGTPSRQRSSEIVVADNLMGSATNPQNYLSGFSPENTITVQGVEKVIVEDNKFVAGPGHVLDVIFKGRDMTGRGNVNLSRGAAAVERVETATALPSEWDGPYFLNRPSLKLRVATPAPRPPGQVSVQ